MPPVGLIGFFGVRITVWLGTISAASITCFSVRPVTVMHFSSRCVADLAHQARVAAGPVEMLHVVVARRLEVDQHRHLAADPVELLEVDVDAEAARDGGEMDQRVGRAADRLQHAQRVAEGGRPS